MTLTSIPTHLVAHIAFGRYDTNEMLYATQLPEQTPTHSLTVFGKGFLSAEILRGLSAGERNRPFLIPAQTNTRREVVSGRPEDALARMTGWSQAPPCIPHKATGDSHRGASAQK